MNRDEALLAVIEGAVTIGALTTDEARREQAMQRVLDVARDQERTALYEAGLAAIRVRQQDRDMGKEIKELKEQLQTATRQATRSKVQVDELRKLNANLAKKLAASEKIVAEAARRSEIQRAKTAAMEEARRQALAERQGAGAVAPRLLTDVNHQRPVTQKREGM